MRQPGAALRSGESSCHSRSCPTPAVTYRFLFPRALQLQVSAVLPCNPILRLQLQVSARFYAAWPEPLYWIGSRSLCPRAGQIWGIRSPLSPAHIWTLLPFRARSSPKKLAFNRHWIVSTRGEESPLRPVDFVIFVLGEFFFFLFIGSVCWSLFSVLKKIHRRKRLLQFLLAFSPLSHSGIQRLELYTAAVWPKRTKLNINEWHSVTPEYCQQHI